MFKISSYLGNQRSKEQCQRIPVKLNTGNDHTVTCEIECLTYLLQDFKVTFEQSSLLYHDNELTRYIATNSVFHEHTKHMK